MAIKLSIKLKRVIARQMRTGRYRSEKAVLEDALSVIDALNRRFDANQHSDTLRGLDASIELGLADARAGRTSDAKEALARIKRSGRERLAFQKWLTSRKTRQHSR